MPWVCAGLRREIGDSNASFYEAACESFGDFLVDVREAGAAIGVAQTPTTVKAGELGKTGRGARKHGVFARSRRPAAR